MLYAAMGFVGGFLAYPFLKPYYDKAIKWYKERK